MNGGNAILSLSLLLLLVCLSTSAVIQTIKVGQFWTDGYAERIRQNKQVLFAGEATMNSTVASLKVWEEQQNKIAYTRDNITFQVNLTLYNIGGWELYPGDIDVINKTMEDAMKAENDTHFWIAPSQATWSMLAAEIGLRYKKIVFGVAVNDKITTHCTEESINGTMKLPQECKQKDDRRFRNYFQLFMYSEYNPIDAINIVDSYKRLKNVVYFSVKNEAFGEGQMNAAMRYMESKGINTIKVISLPNVGYPTVRSRAAITALFDELMSLPVTPDLVFGGTAFSFCDEFMRIMKEKQYAPYALMMYCPATVHSPYVITFNNFACFLSGGLYFDAEFNITTAQYCAEALKYRAYAVDPTGVSGYKAGKVISKLSEKLSDFSDFEKLLFEVQSTNVRTIAGPVQFDSNGGLAITPSIVYQVDANYRNILSPASISNSSLIYPMPKWFEREGVTSYRPSEIVIFILTAIVLLIVIIVAFVTFRLWKSGSYIITAATPVFLLFMLFGCVLCLLSIFFWTVTTTNVAFCYARIPLISVGFIFLFGSILIKTWRIAYLFSGYVMKVYSMSLKTLLLILGLLLSIDAILLVVILAGSQFKIEEQKPQGDYKPFYNYYECKYKQQNVVGEIFTWILVAYKLAIILSGVICSIITRNVKYLHLNESRWIGYSIYSFFLTSIPVLIVHLEEIGVANEAKFIVRSVFILFIILSTMIFLFGPKFYYKIRGKDTRQRLKHSSSTSKVNKKSSSHSSHSEFVDTLEDPDEFEAYLSKDKRKVEHLQRALENIKKVSNETRRLYKRYDKLEKKFVERILEKEEDAHDKKRRK